MSGDRRTRYGLRSNTAARAQQQSYASELVAAPSAGPRYSREYIAPANSRSYASTTHPQRYAPPASGAQNDGRGKSLDQLLADLVRPFSEVRIDEGPASRPAPPRQDAIDEVVQEVLMRSLRTPNLRIPRSAKLLPSDPVFNSARRFARRWDVSDEAVNSHIQLACGYLAFPVILLLNPAPTHERLPFNEMVDKCKTLRWVEDVLYGIGLGLGDVIILDTCPLLGSDRIRELGREGRRLKEQVMAEAYDVTQEMLQRIQPNIILSCQCSTSWTDWNAGGHVVARQLCSSIRGAQNREVKKVALDNRTINVIQAYHPSGFLNNKGDRKAHHDTFGNLLKGVFQTVYSPCASWKSQHLLATRAAW